MITWIAALYFTMSGPNIIRTWPTDARACADNEFQAFAIEQAVDNATATVLSVRISRLTCLKVTVQTPSENWTAPTKTPVGGN